MKKQIYLCFNIPYTYNKSGLLIWILLVLHTQNKVIKCIALKHVCNFAIAQIKSLTQLKESENRVFLQNTQQRK